jgi:hypothetical protein
MPHKLKRIKSVPKENPKTGTIVVAVVALAAIGGIAYLLYKNSKTTAMVACSDCGANWSTDDLGYDENQLGPRGRSGGMRRS